MKLSTNLKTRAESLATGINLFALTTMASAMVYANPWAGAEGAITNVTSSLGTSLKAIATPVAVAAMVFCFIMMMCSKDQKKVEAYRGWLITVVIGTIGIYAIPFILDLAKQIGVSMTIPPVPPATP